MKLNVLAASVAAATSLMLAGAAQAATYMIDDWQIDANSGNFVTASGVGDSEGPTQRTATGGLHLPRLNIFTTVTGIGQAAENTLGDCSTCQFGTFSNNVGTTGYAYWSWDATGVDLSPFTKISMEYFSDLPDADIMFVLFNNDAAVAGSQVQWSDLAATGGPSTAKVISEDLPDLSLLTYDEVRIYAVSDSSFVVPGLGTVSAGDANPDGIDMGLRSLKTFNTPEPTSLALVGLTLAGLGFMRRRRA